MATSRIRFPKRRLEEFCRAHDILRLSLFGSALGRRFRPDSDVDLLVEFLPGKGPGLIGMAGLERELSKMLGGRKVDLRTPRELSRYFRDEVVAEARVQFARS